MTCRRSSVLAIAFVLAMSLRAQTQAPRRLPVPGKSLPDSGRVTRSFDPTGIETVVLRAEAADKAEVKIDAGPVRHGLGRPRGRRRGLPSGRPELAETPASRWGLDFQARRFGPTLVISTENEISYIHHYYHLGSLSITVPQGVRVIKENRKLTGKGEPDLLTPANRRVD